ncbi:DUF4031 domain-containing protein [Rathayibacter sp. VKM Ac-2803]|uniref:DUF4031 domain-containing protein n=1 Tax=Rathayibacter sp. VKM Ac-2803 TaxID=2609256 RepID=UPI001951A528|nr:DUF4031 domain-containing protein [Rathayibacter sp. VKM Ac-2803]
MSVYVDNFMIPADVPNGARTVRGVWCHMTADTTEELLAMARKIGLKETWIQKPGTWQEHFDVTLPKRKKAIAAGAIEVSMLEHVRTFLNPDAWNARQQAAEAEARRAALVAQHLAELHVCGYRDIETHGDLAVGVVVRLGNHQYTDAYRYGSGTIVALVRHEGSRWEQSYGKPDVELIVVADHDRYDGDSRIMRVANYHVVTGDFATRPATTAPAETR